MEPVNTSRRSFLQLVGLGVPASVALAACGGSPSQSGAGGGSGGGKGVASYWTLSAKPQEDIRKDTIARFNKANPKSKIDITLFANDAYKQKVKTAIGAGKSPTMIWGWGGGGLKSYVEADQVVDLTSWFGENPDLKEKRFPATFGAATVNGKLYAVPIETVTPIVLYWNKKVFDQVGAKPPESWGDVMDLVPKFNAKGIAPFALAGQSLWTNMMWLEFLFDRIGGSQVFDSVFNGEKNSWSQPAALQALGEVQKLVKANGFQKGFQSTVADQNADQALLFTGKAAMMVHGAWTYGSMKADGADFVTGGNLGYMNFPPVDGGQGDPSDTVGNPGQYVSISSQASKEAQDAAKKLLTTTMLDDTEVEKWVGQGNIPVVKSGGDLISGVKDANDKPWLQFVYETSSKAKVFAQSWDQALPPSQATPLLDNIGKLFQMDISPQQFADNMNKTIGT
ncbi:MAG: extracellular solute-binding protein family 1 [Marmoricola sp.]|jgi:raffinose/stachyose/melibiose transport system substrate-binding protein|nr:extracellular solute-binding protein family 1 [Marmoricola sp.]